MRIAKHGEEGADHAFSFYRVYRHRPHSVLSCWKWNPITGRTHQLRVHALHNRSPHHIAIPNILKTIRTGIFRGGVQKRLHLHARHIDIPHPSGAGLKITAPQPPQYGAELELALFDQADGVKDDE